MNFLFSEVFFFYETSMRHNQVFRTCRTSREGNFFSSTRPKKKESGLCSFSTRSIVKGQNSPFFLSMDETPPCQKDTALLNLRLCGHSLEQKFQFCSEMSPLKTNFVKTQIDDEFQFCLKVIMKIFKFEMVDI